MRIARASAALACLLLLGTLASACTSRNTVVIGAQTYSEAKILAEMYKALIEDRTDLSAEVIPDLAASPVVIQAMKRNELQMATLYTGEIFNNHFPIEQTKDRAKVLEQAKQGFDKYFHFKWLDPLGFENTYAFTVSKKLADEKGYEKISDVGPDASKLRLGVDTTWLERDEDGYGSFTRTYGFKFGSTFPMEQSLVYQAAANNQVDIVLAYSTDPHLKYYNLQTLADDKQFFPPYDASTIMRNDLAEKHPDVVEAVSVLIGTLSVQKMIDLNYQMDIEKKSEREVALAYLKQTGLLK
ncbi:glycine betaine ABC transporter substrate-binding protein [Paenibacillus sepulcri]|uniref:Osmoprotectant ABC transporter substrate-binding protein n=1 Tax=Paenibacillus sepulcri TaxID=359917 RepID=A0ABS7CFX6_9BACL|nr:osmoprotectant ABC transporter substrate-binding protein [Paenibacillus sepulcri]